MFPQSGQTHIIISYSEEDSKELSYFKEALKKHTEEKLSQLLIYYTENVAYNPTYIEKSFTEEEINFIENCFNSNIYIPLTKQEKVPNLFR